MSSKPKKRAEKTAEDYWSFAHYTTAMGSIPLFIFVLIPYDYWLKLQVLAVAYVAIVLAVIGGLHWYEGCRTKNRRQIIWSVVLSLLPWLSIVISQLTSYYTICWLAVLILVWAAWLVDKKFLATNQSHRLILLSLRTTGTVFITLAIIMNILRLLR